MKKCGCIGNPPSSRYHKTKCVQTKDQKICEGDSVRITTGKGSAEAKIVMIGKTTVELIETELKGGKRVPASDLIVLKKSAFANYYVKKT